MKAKRESKVRFGWQPALPGEILLRETRTIAAETTALPGTNRDMRSLAGIFAHELRASENWDNGVAAFLDIFAAAFLSIDQSQYERDTAAGCLDSFNSLERRAARGDYIFHDYDRIIGRKITLN